MKLNVCDLRQNRSQTDANDETIRKIKDILTISGKDTGECLVQLAGYHRPYNSSSNSIQDVIRLRNYSRGHEEAAEFKTANYLASKLSGKKAECSQEIIDLDEVPVDKPALSDLRNTFLVINNYDFE
ncbi:hypothetical protein BpHYR1_050929 [Brachionus plicatilis]|uniref:Uncharacterized protein n=1 Tax=Brachionus plicatilis TaxID=10195 RepID=A0A3M7R2I0_BRAPC|nr:hypothetical protein BpHYR1_050929 [Brachionus plicatilis]